MIRRVKMFNDCQKKRGFPVRFVVYFILFVCCVVVYLETSRWQNTRSILKDINMVLDEQKALLENLRLLNTKMYDLHEKNVHSNNKYTIIAITPTFARPVQKAELTRLAQAFMHVPNLHWLVVEDSSTKTNLVKNLLAESNIPYTHINVPTSPDYKIKKNEPNWRKPRGLEQRNAALQFIRQNMNMIDNGVVYFADDDNTYSIKLFREMENITKVGIWPVGLVGGLMVEKPIVDTETKKVVGFNAGWKPDRSFPVDMASFAINLNHLREKKDALFSFEAKLGFHESYFLEKLVKREELEPRADLCTQVYVWHTRTAAPILDMEDKLTKKGMKSSNFGIEV